MHRLYDHLHATVHNIHHPNPSCTLHNIPTGISNPDVSGAGNDGQQRLQYLSNGLPDGLPHGVSLCYGRLWNSGFDCFFNSDTDCARRRYYNRWDLWPAAEYIAGNDRNSVADTGGCDTVDQPTKFEPLRDRLHE